MRQPNEPPRELSIEGKTFKMVWRTGGGAVFECQQCNEYTFQLSYGDSSAQIRSESLHICKSKKVKNEIPL